MNLSPLYPVQNQARSVQSLDGLWRFAFDPKAEGDAAGWTKALPNPISMPVPASCRPASLISSPPMKSGTMSAISGTRPTSSCPSSSPKRCTSASAASPTGL